MRALVISTLVGAGLVLSGCQTMSGQGNDIGGVSYDKAALGALIGAAAGYGVSKGINNGSSSQNNRAIAIGAILGGASGLYLDNKEKNYVSKWQVQVLM
jgi:predicted small secreted protein